MLAVTDGDQCNSAQMTTAIRRPAVWLLALGGACACVWLAALFAEHHLESLLVHLFERHAQHPLRVAGGFEGHLLSAHPAIVAWDVEIGNPQWSGPGSLGHVGRVGIVLEWRFAWLPLEIRRVELDKSEWHLRRDAQNRANWTASEAGPGSGPPLIRSLSMQGARVDVDDERLHLKFKGTVSAGDGATGAAPRLRLEAAGELNGRAATLRVDGEPLATARRNHEWHFTLQEQSGGSHLAAQGYFLHPFDFHEIEGSFQAVGPSLHEAYYLIGLTLPESRPFSASGHLSRRDLRFAYQELRVHAGESDLTGTLTVEGGGGAPHTTGELSSGILRLADLGTQNRESWQTLSDSPLRTAGLQQSDVRVRYRAQQLEIGPQKLQGVSVLVVTHPGELQIEQLQAELAGGELTGQAHFQAAGDSVPEAGVELHVRQVHLEQLHGLDRPGIASGSLDGRIDLNSRGRSWHAMMAAAHGEATFVVPRGFVRESVTELASADVVGALGLLRRNVKETPIRCAVMSLEAEQGVVRSRTLVLDTDAALVSGSGELRLDTQTLELQIRGRPKHPTLALRAPVTVSGPLKKPVITLQKRGALLQGGAALALGTVLTPLAAVLAFVDPGLARDADCTTLLAEANSKPPD